MANGGRREASLEALDTHQIQNTLDGTPGDNLGPSVFGPRARRSMASSLPADSVGEAGAEEEVERGGEAGSMGLQAESPDAARWLLRSV